MTSREKSLELQMFTYLKCYQNEQIAITSDKLFSAFYGIASKATVGRLLTSSPFLSNTDGIITASAVDHLADIKYDFKTQADPNNISLIISGKNAKIGSNQILNNVTLYGIGYSLDIRLEIYGVPVNWELIINEIIVISPGVSHTRYLQGNPIRGNTNYVGICDTN